MPPHCSPAFNAMDSTQRHSTDRNGQDILQLLAGAAQYRHQRMRTWVLGKHPLPWLSPRQAFPGTAEALTRAQVPTSHQARPSSGYLTSAWQQLPRAADRGLCQACSSGRCSTRAHAPPLADKTSKDQGRRGGGGRSSLSQK